MVVEWNKWNDLRNWNIIIIDKFKVCDINLWIYEAVRLRDSIFRSLYSQSKRFHGLDMVPRALYSRSPGVIATPARARPTWNFARLALSFLFSFSFHFFILFYFISLSFFCTFFFQHLFDSCRPQYARLLTPVVDSLSSTFHKG